MSMGLFFGVMLASFLGCVAGLVAVGFLVFGRERDVA